MNIRTQTRALAKGMADSFGRNVGGHERRSVRIRRIGDRGQRWGQNKFTVDNAYLSKWLKC